MLCWNFTSYVLAFFLITDMLKNSELHGGLYTQELVIIASFLGVFYSWKI